MGVSSWTVGEQDPWGMGWGITVYRTFSNLLAPGLKGSPSPTALLSQDGTWRTWVAGRSPQVATRSRGSCWLGVRRQDRVSHRDGGARGSYVRNPECHMGQGKAGKG